MIIKLKNTELSNMHDVLLCVTTKGRKGRAVAKMMRLIQSKQEDFASSQMDIVSEYDGKVDESGNVIWPESNMSDAREAMYELAIEDVIIDLTEFQPFLEYLINALYEDISDISGETLSHYDMFLDKLESIKENGDD